MKKSILITILLLVSFNSWAQEVYNSSGKQGNSANTKKQKDGFDPSRLVFGGGIGGGFGSDLYGNSILSLGISPIIGYSISDRFIAGVSLGYQYYWQKNAIYVLNHQTALYETFNSNLHIFSPGIWSRFVVWNNIFLHAEFEYNIFSINDYERNSITNELKKKRIAETVPSLLLGGGFRQPISDRASFVIMALYDVFQHLPVNQRYTHTGERYSISPYANRLDIRIGLNIGF